MSYGFVLLCTLLPIYMVDFLSVYVAYLLAGRRMPYRRILALQIPLAIAQSMAYSALFVMRGNRLNEIIFYFKDVIFHVAEFIIILSWVYYLLRNTNQYKRFFYVSTAYPFMMAAAQIAFTLIHVTPHDLLWAGGTRGSLSKTPVNAFWVYAAFLIAVMAVAAVVRGLSKTSFWRKLQALENYPQLYIPMGVFGFVFYAVFITFAVQYISKPLILPITSLGYLALLAAVARIVNDIKRTNYLIAAHNLVLQQQNYINKLESIHQELRSVQHDYKNILFGLYAQASEGNVEAVRKYIETKLLKVDETVRENLRQMNQLAYIEIPELKGLILTKMLEAERDRVFFRLEAIAPVNRVFMEMEDVLRCLGILLDNAIEEARTQKGGTVSLLLLQEDLMLTVVVKNSFQVKPELGRIWQDGYSTKGLGRGIGLSNYRNIIHKYPNVTQETKIEGHHFVQVLTMMENY